MQYSSRDLRLWRKLELAEIDRSWCESSPANKTRARMVIVFLALWSLERAIEYEILNILFTTNMAIPTSSSRSLHFGKWLQPYLYLPSNIFLLFLLSPSPTTNPSALKPQPCTIVSRACVQPIQWVLLPKITSITEGRHVTSSLHRPGC